ncbi:uncharacterized protein SOCEGT47_025770 [Sorangium cellulosum]|uniref:HEAT repeat domain-containing protein n=1 Tax=Sorangium cellulosum TaxID=56 RepID=A0A4P2PZN7_SORCE|nr:hypothetical protein [Sorangium cellulosum]AUX22076.1 uncharacterized protein SOCEGT47_025770 [Sorangium cellulosum]
MTKAIVWKKLKHARGPATRVPAQVQQLLAEDGEQRDDAFSALQDTLIEKGRWFEASAPAVALLLDTAPKASEPDLLLVLAADALGADHMRAWLAPRDEALPAEAVTVHEAALARKQALLGWLEGGRPPARAAAAVVLATLPEIGGEALSLLRRRALDDPEPVVRASALLALGRLSAGDDDAVRIIDAARGAEHPLVRGAGTVAWLRFDAGRSFAEVAEGIEAWLGWQPTEPWTPEQTWLPWFGGLGLSWYTTKLPLGAAASALVALTHQRGASGDLVQTALHLGSGAPSGRVMRRLSAMVLDLGGFMQFGESYVALPEELSPEQRAIAEGLARTELVPIAGLGVPACGASRRRWIGLAPPGPVEREVEVEIAGSKKILPVWRAWKELLSSGVERSGPIPPPLDGMLTGHDRWRAIVEFDSESYGFACYMDPDQLERQLAAIPHDEELLRQAAEVADDLASRFAAAAREQLRVEPSFTTSAMLLLPLVRAGRRIEQRWEILIHPGDEPQVREIFQALAPERREAWVLDYLDRRLAGRETMYVISIAKTALPFVALALTPRTVEALARTLTWYKEQVADSDADELFERLRELAAGQPDLVRALGATG